MPAVQIRRPVRTWLARLAGAALCAAVAVIHVIDQGGIPGDKTPSYVGAGYYAVEIIGVATAVLLLAGPLLIGWFLAVGVGAGPFLGYVLSRGPGLPGYTSDVGNWTEPLGLVSLAVEGVLVVLAATLFLRRAGFGRRPLSQPGPAWRERDRAGSVTAPE